MSKILVKFSLSHNKSLTPDKKNGGLPRDFILSIPYFQLRMTVNFSDKLKEDGQVNQVDLSSSEQISTQDVILYLQYRKAMISDEDEKLPQPGAGVLLLADRMMDQELLNWFSSKLLDYQAMADGVRPELLSEWAGSYMDRVFGLDTSYRTAIREIRKLLKKYEKDLWADDIMFLQIEYQVNFLDQLDKKIMHLVKVIHQQAKGYHNPNKIDDYQKQLIGFLKKFTEDLNLVLVSSHDNDRAEALKKVWLARDNTVWFCFHKFDIFNRLIRNADEQFNSDNIFDPRYTWPDRVRKFVNTWPGMAQLIWETEEFRKILVFCHLKISISKRRRYMDAQFEDLIPLIEKRIKPGQKKDNREMLASIYADQELNNLYKKYNSELLDCEQYELIWNRIEARKTLLIKKYHAKRQRNASRGVINPSWYK